MRVLIACEESQTVCKAFRLRGHEAYSCDLQDCTGGHPEWHIKGDVLPILREEWDLIIAHPPCTYLSCVANRGHSLRMTPLEKINERTLYRIKAMDFFMQFACNDCPKIAIENPIGCMNTVYRKPDQIIHPYQFAESVNDTANYVTKRTCLWLKGLPLLVGNNLLHPDNVALYGLKPNGKPYCWAERIGGKERSKQRSKTFSGIAMAMAEQWGGLTND